MEVLPGGVYSAQLSIDDPPYDLVGDGFQPVFPLNEGFPGNGIVTKKLAAGMTIAFTSLTPISFGIVILPLASIFTTAINPIPD